MNLEELKNLSTEEKEVELNKYKTQIEKLSNLFAQLKVPYNDLNVLLEDTEELRFVNNFFKDISCGDIETAILLYGIIGNSMAKTAKLNKAFILKRKSAEMVNLLCFVL